MKTRKPLRRIGARGKRNFIKDQEWRLEVMKRDRGRCVLCGVKAQHAHHIYGKQANPHLRHVLANGAALCAFCHNEAHRCVNHVRWLLLNKKSDEEKLSLLEAKIPE